MNHRFVLENYAKGDGVSKSYLSRICCFNFSSVCHKIACKWNSDKVCNVIYNKMVLINIFLAHHGQMHTGISKGAVKSLQGAIGKLYPVEWNMNITTLKLWPTTIRTTTGRRQVLPAGRRTPQWTSRHFPHSGCPAPQTLRCRSPSLDPENRKICISCRVFVYSVCQCVCVCPVILVVCVNSHRIIMAACVLYIVIKGILAQIVITVVHTRVMYHCAAVQRLHVHLL